MTPWLVKDALVGVLKGAAIVAVPLYFWGDDVRPYFVALVDFLTVQAG